MICSRCHNQAIINQPYSGLALCEKHADMDLESRVKHRIRACGGLNPNDKLYLEVFQSNTAEEYTISKIFQDLLKNHKNHTFVSNVDDATIFVTTDTLDDITSTFLSRICLGQVHEQLTQKNKRILDPLATIPKNEVVRYAVSHGWHNPNTSESQDKKDLYLKEISEMLTRMSQNHPSMPYALLKVQDK
ncbi:MAG TPA: hypothetical protein O0X99_01390, partial [Methanocorpusculum sp.]|nr:hypothetical protein [Methanocorpusculum sp.]